MIERRSEIYVQRKTISRLLMVLKLYPNTKWEEDPQTLKLFARTPTVDELADKTLNEVIEREFPLVLKYEKEAAKLEKRLVESGKQREKITPQT